MPDADRYELVSSLWGPGNTGCWYLTILSCLASWTLDPKKRASGSISIDFIAVLAYPAVAAGHLISLVHAFPYCRAKPSILINDMDALKLVAAIETPLYTTDMFMVMGMMLFLVAVKFKCAKRAMLLAVVGLFCFSAEGYLFLSCQVVIYTPGSLCEYLWMNFLAALISISIIIVTLAFGLSLYSIKWRYFGPEWDSRDLGNTALGRMRHRGFLESTRLYRLALGVSFMLPTYFLGLVWQMRLGPSSSRADLQFWFNAAGSRLRQGLFPCTNMSIKDLDQAVALFTGATALVYSFYNVANVHYGKWRAWIQAVESFQLQPLPVRTD